LLTGPARQTPMEHDPLQVASLRARIDAALQDMLGRQARLLERISPDCAPLVEAISDLLRGGKRLRPAFCYWGWRGAGGADGEQIVTAAAALEFFQAAALIHDDLMDRSDLRRGLPSAHVRLAGLHRVRGWSGEPQRFGSSGALLAGDLCLVWSEEMYACCGLPAERLEGGRAALHLMRTELMAGQYLDVLEQAVAGRDPLQAADRAMRVIRHKSARYSIEQPLLIGAGAALAPPSLMATYSAFGLALGEAFQLRDDVLGVFGEPAVTGKPAGDDLREGKRTVLVALTMQRASSAGAARVQRLLGDPGLDPDGVATLREMITSSGALAAVERMIDARVDAARAALAAGDVEPDAHTVLADLVVAATVRGN
jgi:geranylgeranyl diphosphate synthase type I